MRKYFIILIPFFIGISPLRTQANTDARMTGLSGTYTTLAQGYRCVGINPANLGTYKRPSLNLMNFSIGLSNNFFSLSNFNTITGVHLEDSLAYNYFPKSQFYDLFGGSGLRTTLTVELPFPLINFSTRQFAFTTQLSSNIDMGLPDGFVDFLLFGNPFGKNISLDMDQFIVWTLESGISFGHQFSNFSAGITLKYILGLFYMGLESVNTPFLTTDISGFTGKNQYLIQQAVGGSGLGLDVGITTKESATGVRAGISIINLLGTVKWTQDHFMRSSLENSLVAAGDWYLRPNEFMLMSIVMDSVTALSFTEKSSDPLIYLETYKVISVADLEAVNFSNEDSSYMVQLNENAYLLPSGGKYSLNDLIGENDVEKTAPSYYQYVSGADNPFTTRQPMYLRLGLSKNIKEYGLLAGDLVTGFSNRRGSSSSWRMSIGAELLRFKPAIFRIGYSFGGFTQKSMSLGYGIKIGSFRWDTAIAFNGGFSINDAKGFNLALGLIWQR